MFFVSRGQGWETGGSLALGQAWQSPQPYRWLWGLAIALVAGGGIVGCGGASTPSQTLPSSTPAAVQPPTAAKLAKGDYPVQQVRYSETTGDYTLTLLNRPAGQSPLYTLREVMLAQLSRPDQQAGKGSFLRVEDQRSVLYLKPDFKIDYVPNVSQGSSATPSAVAWRPWGGDRSLDYYQPYYYQPPFYSSSGMYGYGGYGSSYQSSIDHYQQRNNRLPPAQKRANFRNTSNLRSPASPAVTDSPKTSPKTSPQTSPAAAQSPSVGSSSKPAASPSQAASPSRRATGAGYGSSTLRTGSSSSGSARSSSSSSGRSSFGSSSRSSSSSSRSSSGRRR